MSEQAILVINLQQRVLTVKCPKCGKKLETPDRKIENSHFCLAAYTCTECGTNFKVSY
jgi:transposase-like protein